MIYFLSYIFVICAAICNAVMDKIKDTIQFNSSCFRKLNPLFWDDQRSSGVFLPLTRYKTNAWHLFKSIMLIFLFLAIIFSTFIINQFLSFCLFGFLWVLVFNLFYNYIFKR